MVLEFSKMHGLGNDFIVVDATREPLALGTEQIRRLANRQLGIGFDQLLVVEPASDKTADFRYRIYNADGGEVEHCGNGARCFARFVMHRGLADARAIVLQTSNRTVGVEAIDDSTYRVDMGVPELDPARIPVAAADRQREYSLVAAGKSWRFGAVSMGNPHAVLLVDDVDTAPVHTLGPELEHHSFFPERVNVGFCQKLSRRKLRLRVWERGVGETRACGTGACAAAVHAQLLDLVDQEVTLQLLGGELSISWAGEGQPLYMSGPAEHVFDGTVDIQ